MQPNPGMLRTDALQLGGDEVGLKTKQQHSDVQDY